VFELVDMSDCVLRHAELVAASTLPPALRVPDGGP